MNFKIDINAVSHAYIIEAPWSFDKERYALDIAKALLCEETPGEGCGHCAACKKVEAGNHVDVTVIEATKEKGRKVASLKNKDLEKVQDRLLKTPMDGPRNIAIIKDADTMTKEAANRFLKTLEEPSPGTVIMLLSENINKLEETIRSRCIHIRLSSEGEADYEQFTGDADTAVRLLKEKAPYHELRSYAEKYSDDKKTAYSFIDAMEASWLRTIDANSLAGERKKVYEAVEELEKARREIEGNITIVNTLKKTLLKIGG
jgi:DNA polymerase-3 subunit delta'